MDIIESSALRAIRHVSSLLVLSAFAACDGDEEGDSACASDSDCQSGCTCSGSACVLIADEKVECGGECISDDGCDDGEVCSVCRGRGSCQTPIDAGVGSGCDEVFGSAAGYVLCQESSTSCLFYTVLNKVETCACRCAIFGGTCISASGEGDSSCEVFKTSSCDEFANDQICECSLP